jgi:hypothetical protein
VLITGKSITGKFAGFFFTITGKNVTGAVTGKFKGLKKRPFHKILLEISRENGGFYSFFSAQDPSRSFSGPVGPYRSQFGALLASAF